jgi:hypothetical protein
MMNYLEITNLQNNKSSSCNKNSDFMIKMYRNSQEEMEK